MAQELSPTSILELLTHSNPPVLHETPKSNTNTRGPKWYFPKQLKRWEEFENFENLEAIFGGRLLREARRGGRALPQYPTMHRQVNFVIRNEAGTRDVIHKWNQEVVTAALDPIHREFHPVIWAQGDPPLSKESSELPPPLQEKERTQPMRQSTKKSRGPRSQSLSRLMPDSGSIAWNSSPTSLKSSAGLHRQERFPKEYKVATKWRSEWVIERELIDDSGEWQKGSLTDNCAMPIRQAFTYCIQHMCRYGCILTCKEAFIFRVKPRDGEPTGGSGDLKRLRSRLIENGLMEYISVPWDNHCDGDTGDYKTWTVNLALWFVHVLAGNKFEADWHYGLLKDEELAVSTSFRDQETPDPLEQRSESMERGEEEENSTSPPTQEPIDAAEPDSDLEELDEESISGESDNSDKTIPIGVSSATKRKRDSEPEDGYNLSFSKRLFSRGERQLA